MVNKLVPIKSAFKFLNIYNIFGYKLFFNEEKMLALKFKYFPDFFYTFGAFHLKENNNNPKQGHSHVAFLMFVVNMRTLKIELSLPFT